MHCMFLYSVMYSNVIIIIIQRQTQVNNLVGGLLRRGVRGGGTDHGMGALIVGWGTEGAKSVICENRTGPIAK
jgi:hypothetical protein